MNRCSLIWFWRWNKLIREIPYRSPGLDGRPLWISLRINWILWKETFSPFGFLIPWPLATCWLVDCGRNFGQYNYDHKLQWPVIIEASASSLPSICVGAILLTTNYTIWVSQPGLLIHCAQSASVPNTVSICHHQCACMVATTAVVFVVTVEWPNKSH